MRERQKSVDEDSQSSLRIPFSFLSRTFPSLWLGWVVYCCGCLPLKLAESPGLTFFLGLYTERLILDLQVSREYVSALFLAAQCVSFTWVLLFLGRIVDRYGPWRTVCLGQLVFLSAIFVLSSTNSRLLFILSYFCLRMFGPETMGFCAIFTVNRWFHRWRGRAMAGLQIVLGVQLLCAAAFDQLMTAYGWRSATRMEGVLVLIILQISLFFLVERPETVGQRADGVLKARPSSSLSSSSLDGSWGEQQEEEQSYTFKEAIQTWQCWALVFSTIIGTLGWGGLNVHIKALLAERKQPDESASIVYTAVGILAPVGAFCMGAALDICKTRTSKLKMCSLVPFSAATSMGIACVMQSISVSIIFGMITGVFIGSLTVVNSTIFASLYGRKNIGRIQALFGAGAVLGSGLGPVGMSTIFVVTGAYERSLLTFCILNLCMGILLLRSHAPSDRLPTQQELEKREEQADIPLAQADAVAQEMEETKA
uniref:Major facilitator superfamily (MFS) profile domain-containing protein n=1 Tax=Hanusia phi TaxID=3032 RepID=A0A7S0HPF1_9CRYP|mmetsp:Transcript_27549/g.62512  ORF Transcript_27549/g.62512 Transcript_27549/m.62512 type:complete len:482 (+) Transcript_27549:24-1469(+)